MFLPGSGAIAWGHLRHQLHLADIGIAMEQGLEIVLTEREIRAASVRVKGGRGVDGFVMVEAPTPRMLTAFEQELSSQFAPTGGEPVSIADLTRTVYTVPMVSGRRRGGGVGHIPDMVLLRRSFEDGRSGNVALELELTRKPLSDWKSIVESYVRHEGYAQVQYFFTSPDLLRSFVSVVAGVPGGVGKVSASLFVPVDQAWDPAGTRRQAGRRVT